MPLKACRPRPGLAPLGGRALGLERPARAAPRRKHQSVVGAASSTPAVFPPFTLIARMPAYDLRLYAPHWVISTPYTRRDEGFERLGSYGAGANAAQATSPAAAQPVVMWFSALTDASPSPSSPASASAPADKRMTLHVVGAGAPGAGPPPAPTTPGVSLDVAGGEALAVARFEGYATPGATAGALAALLAALAADGVRLSPAAAGGAFRLAQYGPLFTMETRVNEVQVGVALG